MRDLNYKGSAEYKRTSIPTDEVVDLAETESYAGFYTARKNGFTSIASTMVSLNEKYYLRTLGTAIGTKMVPTYANLSNIEKENAIRSAGETTYLLSGELRESCKGVFETNTNICLIR